MVKDVVCGISVDPADAPAEMEFEGVTYCFCSAECKSAFAADPVRYADAGLEGHRRAG
ncbi:MAG TPA: YHS domain-containing protein [Dehalococcoidia bacterium]|nr:YHS domain-containing protein [Dehalococcoidia bacterium]